MRRLAGLAAGVLLVATLAGCSSAKQGWTTPDDALNGIKAAGFSCVLPTSDTVGQVLTTDPFTGADLGGNSLVRCPDFQVMLATGTVEEAFALLVKCQAVPQDIRQSAEWSSAIVVGPNFVILPADLSKGWAQGAQTGDMTKAFGGTMTTFGELYDKSCASVGESAAPVASSSANPFASPSAVPPASAVPSAS